MRRRLTRSILFVTAMTLLTLGLPLAIVVYRYYENSATVDLQRRAAEGLAELPLPFDAATVDDFDLGGDAPFGVYDASGALIAGSGPARADRATMAALHGEPSFDHSTETLVYASPQMERGGETVTAVVRVSEPDALIDARDPSGLGDHGRRRGSRPRRRVGGGDVTGAPDRPADQSSSRLRPSSWVRVVYARSAAWDPAGECGERHTRVSPPALASAPSRTVRRERPGSRPRCRAARR